MSVAVGGCKRGEIVQISPPIVWRCTRKITSTCPRCHYSVIVNLSVKLHIQENNPSLCNLCVQDLTLLAPVLLWWMCWTLSKWCLHTETWCALQNTVLQVKSKQIICSCNIMFIPCIAASWDKDQYSCRFLFYVLYLNRSRVFNCKILIYWHINTTKQINV